MTKVVVITNRFPVTSETFVVDHVIGLAAHGFDVIVLTHECCQEEKNKLMAREGVCFELELIPECKIPKSRLARVVRLLMTLGIFRLPAFLSVWERDFALRALPLMHKIDDIRPDIIHAHFGPNAMMAALVAGRLNTPLYANFHGYDVTEIPKLYGWSAYHRWLADAHIIAHSSFVEALVKANISSRVTKVSLGVDASKFQAPKRLDAWSKHLNFLVVARAVYQKGIHVAIAMLSVFKHRYPHFNSHLTVCGDGPEMKFLKQCAILHAVEQDVIFLGDISYESVAEEMAQADILLIPSVPVARGSEEAFCRVAIEGMAMGLCVIGSETGGLKETIGPGGQTCRAGSPWELFKRVENLILHSCPDVEAEKAILRSQNFTIEGMQDEYAKIIG